MRNIDPLSERFDLAYVRRRHWPDSWTSRLGALAALAAAGWIGAGFVTADYTIYSGGSLTTAHSMFADDCSQCHQPDPARSGYWLAAQDSACLRCHAAPLHNPHQSMFVGSPLLASGGGEALVMSGNCASCHVEHRGANHDLRRIHDNHCIQCHRDLGAFGRAPQRAAMFDGSAP